MSEQRKELISDNIKLPSQYWEIGLEDQEYEEQDEDYIPNYDEDPPFD